MFGIRYKAMNNAKNEWEWRWAKGQDHKRLEFVTASEAWAHKERAFAGRSLAEVQVSPLKELA